MKTIQITAVCHSGANLIWDEDKNDFVAYENEVPNTSESEYPKAVEKAKEYEGIISVHIAEFND